MHNFTPTQQFISGPKQHGESTPMKFAVHQKITTNQDGIPLKRSTGDTNSGTSFLENMARRPFESSLSQMFSSHRAEPHISDGSPFLHEAVEDQDVKPFGLRAPSRLTSDSADLGFSSRQSISSTREGSIKGATQRADPSLLIRFHEEWAHERDELISQLAAKDEENAALSKKIARMETVHQQTIDKTRDSIGRAGKSYATLKSEFDALKVLTISAVSDANAAKDGFAALRDSAQSGLRDCESLFDEDGEFVLAARTKELVHELRSELSKTQQVADLFRDKLHNMGTELAEAKSRNAELELLAVADRERSEAITVKIGEAASQMLELNQSLQVQQHESSLAKAKAAEMEAQLLHAQTSLREAQSTIASMKEDMTTREELCEEQSEKLRTLRHTIEFQEGNMRAIEARAQKAEEELLQALMHNHELKGRLEPAKELERDLKQQASRLLSERDEAKARAQSLERQLSEAQARENARSLDMAKTANERDVLVDKLKSLDHLRCEVDVYREKYTECQVSWKALQERFDDQCVTLAASKESIGELQETLREMTHVQKQNEELKTRLHRAEKDIEDRRDSLQALQRELSDKECVFKISLQTERSGKDEALRQLQHTKTQVGSLLAESAQKDCRLKEMAERLAAAESSSDEQEVVTLKSRIGELEATEKRLAERAATITTRYKENDLNDDEKALVTQLLQKARAIHEREAVEKANAIKLQKTVIKQYEDRIQQLEASLSRRLQEESAKSSNEQGNSMAVDATKPQRPPSDRHPEIRGAGHVAPSPIETHGGATAATAADGATVNLALPGPSSRSAGSTNFTKLCREATDDIADFEDDTLRAATETTTTTTGKRVMFAEVESESESLRPARRMKHGRTTTGVEKMAVDQAVLTDSTTGTGNRKKAPPKRR